MITYEVNIKIMESVYLEYIHWLKLHIKEMLNFDGFIDHQLFYHHPDIEDKSYRNIVVHYRVDCIENLEKYFSISAPNMRKQAQLQFENKFTITRRILTPL